MSANSQFPAALDNLVSATALRNNPELTSVLNAIEEYLGTESQLGSSLKTAITTALSGTFAALESAPHGPVLSAMTGTANEAFGVGALANNTGNDNTALGYFALGGSLTGGANAAIGTSALASLTSGTNNVALGYHAAQNLTTGGSSVAIGSTALAQMQTGVQNTAVGYGAMVGAQGSYCVAVGDQAMGNYNAAQYCTAVGYQAMGWASSGSYNTAVGTYAMCGAPDFVLLETALVNGTAVTSLTVQAIPYAITNCDSITVTWLGNTQTFVASAGASIGATSIAVTSQTANFSYPQGSWVQDTGPGNVWGNTFQQNVAIGGYTLYNITTGIDNVAIGYESMFNLTTGSGNTGVGIQTLEAATTVSSATAVGYQALKALTTGANNTGIGYGALLAVSTGASNTAVGHNALEVATGSAHTAVGSAALSRCTGSVSGNTAVGANALAALTNGQFNTAVGYEAGQTGNPSYSLALGASTLCTANGAVAIGTDHTGAGASSATQDQISLGTANHTTVVAGNLTVDGVLQGIPAHGKLSNDLLGQSFDPAAATATHALTAAATLFLARIPVQTAITVTNVLVELTAVGATLTNSFVALFNSSGTLIGQSADQSSAWGTGGTTGLKTVALASGPFTITPANSNDFVWAAIYVGSTTGTLPTFSNGATSASLINAGTTAARTRFGDYSVPNTSTLGNITPGSIAQVGLSYWMGLS